MAENVKCVGQAEEVSVILTKQRDVAVSIERLVANIKKTNVLSRTAANREAKWKELNELWQLFQSNHETLLRDLPNDHPHLREKLSEATQKYVDTGNDKLETWKSLKEKTTITGAYSKTFDKSAEEKEADTAPNPNREPDSLPAEPQRHSLLSVVKWKRAEILSKRPSRQLCQPPTADKQRHIV